MKVEVPYGDSGLSAALPDHALRLLPGKGSVVSDAAGAIGHAVSHPIGTGPLRGKVKKGDKIAIVINDITRPAPTREILEELFRELSPVGIPAEDIVIIVATGTHRPNGEDELRVMVGEEILNGYRIVNHNCLDGDNLVDLGPVTTARGELPVLINRLYAEADVKIVTGIITPHQGAGFSGGRKAVAPGICGFQTIQLHHFSGGSAFTPQIGKLENNSFHEEALLVAQKAGVDFMVNVVKNYTGEIVAAVAGDLVAAHEQGVKICRETWEVPVPHTFDICVISPGGFPFDIDLDISQKALSCAEMITGEGSVIVLVAECRQGIGVFERFFREAESPRDLLERFSREGFSSDRFIKAALLARASLRNPIIIVSGNISHADAKTLFLHKADSVDEALKTAAGLLNNSLSCLKVAFVPYGTSIVPVS